MSEPTNTDILSAVEGLKNEVQGLKGEVQDLKEGVHELNRRMGAVESRLGNVEEILSPLSQAFDIDSEKLVNHEGRITALELKLS